MASNEVSQNFEYKNAGFLNKWDGPYPTKEAACLAIQNVVGEDGRNFREGKLPYIGVAPNLVRHEWRGGFGDENLVEVLKGLARTEEVQPIVESFGIDETTIYSFVFADGNNRVSAYVDLSGAWRILKWIASSIPGDALQPFNGSDKIKPGTITYNLLDAASKAGMGSIETAPGYQFVLMDPQKRYVIAVRDDGTVIIPKLESSNSLSDKSVDYNKLSDMLRTLLPFFGKNALFIGDSITAALKYQLIVASRTGLNVSTHAKGGIGLIQMVDGDGAATNPIAPLTATQLQNQDIVCLFGSLNDRYSLVGQRTDTYPAQQTIYAKMKYVINKIYTLAASVGKKDIRLILIAPHKVGKYSYIDADGGQEFPAGSGQTLENIVNAIKDIGGFYGIPVIDLYRNSGINNYNWDILTENTGGGGGPYPENKDNVHPSNAGHALIGRYIASQINNL